MTLYGNRDLGRRGLTAVSSEGAYGEVDGTVVTALPDARAARALGTDARRVVLRIHGDDDIVVGRAEGREPAVQLARELVRHIEAAASRGEWPQINERFIRPGAIVSIDVQRGE